MSVKIVDSKEVQDFLRIVSGLTVDGGDARTKTIVHRILSDLYRTIEDLDVTPDEFWAGVSYLNELGAAGEAGLLAAGTGLEHYLDLRMDAADAAAGVEGGTPRTIEGPLYVAGAPLSEGFAKLDDGADKGHPILMHGTVRDAQGQPLANAIVDVWHANTKGMYSYFDKSQTAYNLRRRIRTNALGIYRFESIMPSGYGCPPDGPTQALLDQVGRHGQRPAHIHFFVSAHGYRKLTTQINIAGDRYLYDDFAYATREELIPQVIEHTELAEISTHHMPGPYAEISFDFTLSPATQAGAVDEVHRKRVEAA
ncbi:hypothetical protein XB05_19225 [Xanthomonas arboricola]|uniref:catechol 1,2-dioxygenase n=1 Tax=Xanthomonas arboricola TaxID=56448 RepID=UPI00061A2FD5|nr:catechol 1,2-dioxygenase [Xanthomonas arboricola]AKC80632.1 hypothetical protein XB05_19225 [Xanthomonas arboricola]